VYRCVLYASIIMSPKYTTGPRVCGHLLVEHLIPKSWALITASTFLRMLSTRCWNHCCGDLVPFSHKGISEVGHGCWTIRPGSQSAFQFIPKVFDGVEIKALCRPVKFFHTDLNKLFLYGPRFAWERCHAETGSSPNCCHKVGSTESSRM
jgi:hypothetical protein